MPGKFTEALHPRDAGKFAAGGGAGAAAKPAPAKAGAAKAAPAKAGAHGHAAAGGHGSLSFNGKTGAGYGKRGGDPRVHSLQGALNKLGFHDAAGHKLALDGKLGPKTTAAVKAAQKKLGMKADGVVSPTLLQHLTAQAKAHKPGTTHPRPSHPHKAAAHKAAPAKAAAPAKTAPAPNTAAKHSNAPQSHAKASGPIRPVVPARRSEEFAMPQEFQRTYALDTIEIQRGGDGRTVEAYAAVFNQPTPIRDQHGEYNEVIAPSAFTKTLVERAGRVGCFYNHGMTLQGTPSDMGGVPLGSPVSITADARGLLTVTRYNRTPLADSVLEAIKAGDIRGQSFRGRIYKSTPTGRVQRARDGSLTTVTRTELGLIEYGPTPFPAYEGAGIMAVRADQLLAQMLHLSAEEREEMLRLLQSTPSEPDGSDTTPDVGAGTDESPDGLSARLLAIRRSKVRLAMITKGLA